MALPSSRRPVYAQQLLDEESIKIRKDVLKVKINVPQAVLAELGSWYKEDLSDKAKASLTVKRFKRYVLKRCYDLQFDYDYLPPNWLETMKETYGLILHERKKKVKEESKTKFPAYVWDEFDDEEEDDVDGGPLETNKSIKDELYDLYVKSTTNTEFTITEGSLLGTPIESSFIDDDSMIRETRSSLRKRNNDSLQERAMKMAHSTPNPEVDEEMDENPVPKKRFVDLSNEPPPLKWIASAAKGIILPRILRVYSSNDMNIIFYDYEPTPEEYPPGSVIKRPGFHWWDNEIREQMEFPPSSMTNILPGASECN